MMFQIDDSDREAERSLPWHRRRAWRALGSVAAMVLCVLALLSIVALFAATLLKQFRMLSALHWHGGCAFDPGRDVFRASRILGS